MYVPPQTARISSSTPYSPACNTRSKKPGLPKVDLSDELTQPDEIDPTQLTISVHENNRHIFEDSLILNHSTYLKFIYDIPSVDMGTYTKRYIQPNTIKDKPNTVMKLGNDSLLDTDFDRLQTFDAWYSDAIINMYFQHVLEPRQHIINKGNNNYRPWVYMNSYFIFTMLNEGNKDLKGNFTFANWKKNTDMTRVRGIIIPYCQGKCHWTLTVVDFDHREMQYMDSLGNDESPRADIANQRFEAVKKYLLIRKKNNPTLTPEINFDEWVFRVTNGITRQKDGFNCGVFCCIYADMIQLNHTLNFGEQLLSHYRKYVLHQFLNFWEKPSNVSKRGKRGRVN